jgi:hypothetical protein
MLFRTIISLTLIAINSSATASDLSSRLDEEEKTWHKYFVFTTAVTSKMQQERAEAQAWLRNKLASPESVDSRYAITYSYLTWQVKTNQNIVESVRFAIAGYMALQFETTHCETRKEATQVARQWYDYVRPQIQGYITLQREVKEKIFADALLLATKMTSVEATEGRTGADWICYLLPSYLNQITKLPDAKIESRSQGENLFSFTSHPSIRPMHPTPEVITERQKSIIEDMRSW